MKPHLILIVILLTGCATYGTKIDQTKTTDIQKGITTEREVVELFGVPDGKTVTDEGDIKMTYTYVRSKPKLRSFIPYVNLVSSGVDTNQQTLSILIKDGVVENYAVNEKETEMMTGLFR